MPAAIRERSRVWIVVAVGGDDGTPYDTRKKEAFQWKFRTSWQALSYT